MNLFQTLHEPNDSIPGADGNLSFLFAVGIPVFFAIFPSLIWGVNNGYWFFFFVGIGTGPIAAIQTCFKCRPVIWGAPVWIPWMLFDIIFILSGKLVKLTFEEILLIIAIVEFIVIRCFISTMTFETEFGIKKTELAYFSKID